MNIERQEYTFLWLIEKYSYCNHKNGEVLSSPEFTADDLEGTAWCVRLYPRGDGKLSKDHISLYLKRSNHDAGPEDFPLQYELSVLAEDGSTMQSKEIEHTFKTGNGHGYQQFLPMDEVLLRKKADYLHQDTLRVLCKLRRGEGNLQQVKHIAARTRIGIEHISFLHVTESFSTLDPNEKKTINIRSPSKNGLALSFSLCYSDDSWCEGKIIVEITPSDTDQILSRFKISLLDISGKVIQCGEADNRLDGSRKDIKKIPLSLTRQVILNRKSMYLPDDKLSLQCECIFSTGVELQKIERTLHGLPMLALNPISDIDQNKDIYDVAEKMNACPSALDEFREIYNNRLLTDMELKTKTKSFPAHTIVLCARSSVFKAMLTNDMKEKNTNCINVDDLDNDTVQQLLLFMYSDNIENLEWESAIKLYYAGDKYTIEKLKLLCSSFLVKNLSGSTASELLLLADTHNDAYLKKVVEDFIFQNEEQVFGSEEWRNLIKTNPVLVSETMCLKYMRIK